MTENEGGPIIDQGRASKPSREERITGNAGEKGEKRSPGGRDRGEMSSTDDPAPVDLDSARDRAS